MLGTFPKNFPEWQLPKCANYQAATSQVCPSRSNRPPQSVIAAALSPILAASLGFPPLQPAVPQRD